MAKAKKCKSPLSDFQQCEAYRWEDDVLYWHKATNKPVDLYKALRKACRLYRVPTPALRLLKHDGNTKYKVAASTYEPDFHRINLRPRHYRLPIILHEAAHSIVDWIMGPHSRAAHGKAWLGVYLELLAHFKIMPRDLLEHSARKAGLLWSKRVSPKVIRKNHPAQVRDSRRMRRLLSLYQ